MLPCTLVDIAKIRIIFPTTVKTTYAIDFTDIIFEQAFTKENTKNAIILNKGIIAEMLKQVERIGCFIAFQYSGNLTMYRIATMQDRKSVV